MDPYQFRNFCTFCFDTNFHKRYGIEQWKRILVHLGVSDCDNVEKDELIEFIHDFGAQELRKATDDLAAYDDASMDF